MREAGKVQTGQGDRMKTTGQSEWKSREDKLISENQELEKKKFLRG